MLKTARCSLCEVMYFAVLLGCCHRHLFHISVYLWQISVIWYTPFSASQQFKKLQAINQKFMRRVAKKKCLFRVTVKSRLQHIYWTPSDYEYNLSTRKTLVALSLIKDPYKSISHIPHLILCFIYWKRIVNSPNGYVYRFMGPLKYAL
jgi:hypothetical protein